MHYGTETAFAVSHDCHIETGANVLKTIGTSNDGVRFDEAVNRRKSRVNIFTYLK